MIARRFAQGLRGEEGLTLVETLVTTTVSFLIIGALAAGYLAGLRAFDSYEYNSRVERDVELARTFFADDVRSAVPSASTITPSSPTRVELSPAACPPTALVCGSRLVLGIYDDKSGSFNTIVWEYTDASTDASKTLTRRVTIGNDAGPVKVIADTLYPGFTGADNPVFTIEADGITVTLAMPVPPFASSTQQSEIRKIRATMRLTKR